jgi:hypothetical protein
MQLSRITNNQKMYPTPHLCHISYISCIVALYSGFKEKYKVETQRKFINIRKCRPQNAEVKNINFPEHVRVMGFNQEIPRKH